MIIIGAIALCVISFMIIGMLWYSPFFLGKPWSKLTGMGPDKVSNDVMNVSYGISAFGAVLTAIALNLVMSEIDIQNIQEALALAFVLWLGISFPNTLMTNRYQGKPMKLTWIDSSYQLATILASASILFFFMFR